MEEEDEFIVSRLSALHKLTSFELIQNCDLPPPQKLLPGSDNALLSPSPNTVLPRAMGRRHRSGDGGHTVEMDDHYLRPRASGIFLEHEDGDRKLGLLTALRWSQARAREAAKEKDCIANALIHESMRSLAYRHCVKLLELEVLVTKSKSKWISTGHHRQCHCCCSSFWRSMIILAVSLGISGTGLAFASKLLMKQTWKS